MANGYSPRIVTLMKWRKGFSIAILALVVLPVIFPLAKGTNDYEPQPADYDSTLPTATIRPEVGDDDLAFIISASIGSEYKDMIFVFGQCYGGGFIDELRGVTTGYGPVAILSASRHDQYSYGMDGKNGESYFLKAFVDALDGNQTATIKWLFYKAEENDPCGPINPDPDLRCCEDPQFFSQPQPAGDDIRLHDGTSNYAILYAGSPDQWRHWNNVVRIHDELIELGYSDADIFVLYGNLLKPDGTPTPVWVDSPATWPTLAFAIHNVGMQMDADATLFFWVTNHGGRQKKIMTGEEYLWIPPQDYNSTYFALTSDFIRDLHESITYSLPYISLNYTPATANNKLYLNDHFIGELPSDLHGTYLEIDPTIIPLYEENNNLTIRSLQSETLIVANISLSASLIPEKACMHAVGGKWVPVDKFGLLAPYIGLASTIVVATAATAIYVKRVKRRELRAK